MGKLSKTTAEVERDLLEGLDGQPKSIVGYEDFDFNVNNLRISPTTSKPDYDQVEGEYLFAITEEVHGNKITKHAYKIGAGVIWYPHLHWAQTQNQVVNWQIDYKIWAANTLEPAWTTAQNRVSDEFTYTSGTLHQITKFASIDMSSYNSAALHVKIRIRRIADTYTGDARFMGFDFHVPVDQPCGSRQEFIK